MQSCLYSATQYFLGANDDAGQLHETGHMLAGQDSSMNMGDGGQVNKTTGKSLVSHPQ